MSGMFSTIWRSATSDGLPVADPAPPAGGASIEDMLACANRYWRSAGRYEQAHWKAAAKYSRRNRWLGGLSVAFSAILASSAFVVLTEIQSLRWQIGTSLLALLTAITAALVTFLAYGDAAKQHQVAGARFAKSRRTADMFAIEFAGANAAERGKAFTALKAIVDEISSAVEGSPNLSEDEYLVGKRGFDDHYPV